MSLYQGFGVKKKSIHCNRNRSARKPFYPYPPFLRPFFNRLALTDGRARQLPIVMPTVRPAANSARISLILLRVLEQHGG